MIDYWSGRGETSLADLEQAHALLPGEKKYIRGQVELYIGLARAMIGKKDLAIWLPENGTS